MNRPNGCTINQRHCESCGSTSYEDVDRTIGYSACCNEPVVYASCPNYHGRNAR